MVKHETQVEYALYIGQQACMSGILHEGWYKLV